MTNAVAERDVAGAIAAGRSRNENLLIDFDEGMTGAELDASNEDRKSRWAFKLAELRQAVEGGKGEFGKFYKIGVFSNAAGARNVIRGFEKNPEKAPGPFEMKTRVVPDGSGGRASELWAKVLESDAA